jgi:hypothetical protein
LGPRFVHFCVCGVDVVRAGAKRGAPRRGWGWVCRHCTVAQSPARGVCGDHLMLCSHYASVLVGPAPCAISRVYFPILCVSCLLPLCPCSGPLAEHINTLLFYILYLPGPCVILVGPWPVPHHMGCPHISLCAFGLERCAYLYRSCYALCIAHCARPPCLIFPTWSLPFILFCPLGPALATIGGTVGPLAGHSNAYVDFTSPRALARISAVI